jgi:hypothetical protein
MKKSKILVVGLIGLLMAGGLVLASCGPKCSKEGKCSFNLDTQSVNDCEDKCLEEQSKSGEPRNLSCNC